MQCAKTTSVLIIGAGLIGATTAYALVKRGINVMVIDAGSEAATGASHANGGMLTPSMPDPWNGPGIGKHLLHSLFDSSSGMLLRLHAVPSLLGWGSVFLRHSTRQRHRQATAANFQLAQYSLGITRKWREHLAMDYDSADLGSIKLFRQESAMETPLRIAGELKRFGMEFRLLNARETVTLEPALEAVHNKIAGAIHYPQDGVGNARLFTQAILRNAQKLGCEVHWNTVIDKIKVESGRVTGVSGGAGFFKAEQVVIAAANGSYKLLRPQGIRVPVRPAKGYSITIAAEGLNALPVHPVVDDANHMAIVPIGNNLRIVGTAEFTGNDLSIPKQRIKNLQRFLYELYPLIFEQVNFDKVTEWAGLRPMSADGCPFIGPTNIPGLFLNTGHGHLGWTMAAGSAELLTSQLLGEPCALEPEAYRASRI